MSKPNTAYDIAIALLQERLEIRRKWTRDCQQETSDLMDLKLPGLNPSLILGGDDTRGALRTIDSVAMIQPRYQDNIWLWFRLPFQVYRAGDERLPETVRKELKYDTDDWILFNEKHLRSLSIIRRHPAITHWMYGVVWIEELSQCLIAEEICLLTDTAAEQSIALQVTRSSIDSIPGYSITNNVLDGLQWDHVIVAGGIVLGTLLCPSIASEIRDTATANTIEEWQSSDLDVYIYGLGPEEANEKIRHISSVYQRNLPPGFPFLVVRNSQTVTLYSKWPRRHVQIILKLVLTPVDVLLNFDLDICSVGYNGEQVFMLPRLFKYADKGYGLRFPPSYISALGHDPQWTANCLDFYLRMLGMQHRLGQRPTYSHAQLNSQMSGVLPRSNCLHSFALFMRHVSLWELGFRGTITLSNNNMAASSYSQTRALEDFVYDDSPPLPWDENFELEAFRSSIDAFNSQETEAFLETFHWYSDLERYPSLGEQLRTKEEITAVRVTCTDEVAEVFDESQDLIFPLIVEKNFLRFVNEVILVALERSGVSDVDASDKCMRALTPVHIDYGRDRKTRQDNLEIICLWRLNHISNWQMMDNEMDEIREILWFFQRSNQLVDRKRVMSMESPDAVKRALDDDRRIYSTLRSDLEEFVKWVSAPVARSEAFTYRSSPESH
ncbi:uncharacterized protein EV420DRAFT_1485883 [Desarmillaria tabescens]|uniref:Uncharacterized protein n=1 Tax=Armillaria tabescens TaxID=1929756 RepID=A0AA39MP70_ARMTA|nr:uncharacterized protein EV420DRAFT_1485883 [Desarmillaria tabescens]KAK0440675.1 hypothetical protein EV420DRAFT_1485883 [Desarmillaria tabescens]